MLRGSGFRISCSGFEGLESVRGCPNPAYAGDHKAVDD